ncbi:hypothetical protein HPB49_021047 [Dermacentor silvarum]|uniref:Uncharacterized protein n=1 Tax=Dermacentor silvarum TaxID=543639 RepID=A0ACB8E332_DERSI|nr:hypothetical protein HPB49_021047 [Dermacentor silvarum]
MIFLPLFCWSRESTTQPFAYVVFAASASVPPSGNANLPRPGAALPVLRPHVRERTHPVPAGIGARRASAALPGGPQPLPQLRRVPRCLRRPCRASHPNEAAERGDTHAPAIGAPSTARNYERKGLCNQLLMQEAWDFI